MTFSLIILPKTPSIFADRTFGERFKSSGMKWITSLFDTLVARNTIKY
jgi:hypothetical protein